MLSWITAFDMEKTRIVTTCYVLKLKVGFDVIYDNTEADFTLTFTSATEGEYAGTMRFEYTGDANKTSVKAVSGPFVLE